MWDPSGHWGRKNGKFVHQDITKLALEKCAKKYCTGGINSFIRMLGYSKYESILEGAILPDFLADVKKGKKAKLLKKKYGEDYYKKYSRRYTEKDLITFYSNRRDNMGIANITNTFHGKKKSRLKALKKGALKKIKGKRYNTKSFLILGCVLHSIQDYQAHSYVCDLETYKKTKDKSKFSEKENAFHIDWGDEKENHQKVHQDTKDNPDTVFAFSPRKGVWEWRPKFDSKEPNEQYTASITESAKYMKKIFKKMY